MAGNNRSHAENKTRRVFRPNLVNVTLMSDVLGKKVRLRVSTRGLKTVEHRGGLDAYLMKAHDAELSEVLQQMKRDIKKAQTEKSAA
jgi:large subunit ribosomal protein L28